MAEATPTMVFVYGTLKRGFPNHPLLAASACFAGAASTADRASLVIGPYSVPFLLPTPSPSSGCVVSGELYAASPSALAELDALEGTHIGVYERCRLSVVVDGSGEAVEAEAYFAHPSYAEALWRRCGGEAAEIGEYTMDRAARYIPPSGRSPGASGLIDAIHSFLATDNPVHAFGWSSISGEGTRGKGRGKCRFKVLFFPLFGLPKRKIHPGI